MEPGKTAREKLAELTLPTVNAEAGEDFSGRAILIGELVGSDGIRRAYPIDVLTPCEKEGEKR